jgi:hypothetical protein
LIAVNPSVYRTSITVSPDCSLEGLEALAADDADDGVKAGTTITAHLLALLVTFIGEPLPADSLLIVARLIQGSYTRPPSAANSSNSLVASYIWHGFHTHAGSG